MGSKQSWLSRLNIYGNRENVLERLSGLEGRAPLFILTIASTRTASIPGITVAGANPELVRLTPAADAELVFYGECKVIQGAPSTPDGKPTPALITLTALKSAGIPPLVVDAGTDIKPQLPYISLHSEPGDDIRTGRALERASVERILSYGEALGQSLAQTADYLVLGESIPAGTTTAMGVLTAMGIDAQERMSSSMPRNPKELKVKVVSEGLRAANIQPGKMKTEPVSAIAALGDPMIPAVAGMAIGASNKKPVFLAGGTQMAAVLAVIKAIAPDITHNLVIATTTYVLNDKQSDLRGLVKQITEIPMIGIDLSLIKSTKLGLRAYSDGFVKEGVGAGGAALAAILHLKYRVTPANLLREIESNYENIVEAKLGGQV